MPRPDPHISDALRDEDLIVPPAPRRATRRVVGVDLRTIAVVAAIVWLVLQIAELVGVFPPVADPIGASRREQPR